MMPAMTGGEPRFHHSGPYTQPSSAKRRQAPLSKRSAARTCARFIASVSRAPQGLGDQPTNEIGARLPPFPGTGSGCLACRLITPDDCPPHTGHHYEHQTYSHGIPNLVRLIAGLRTTVSGPVTPSIRHA